MRKTLSFLTIFFCLASFAQNTVPPFINYQAVIRDAGGVPVAEGATITLNFKIFTNSTTLTPVYEEDHVVVVPPNNIINLRIGNGNPIPPLNNFSAVPWNAGTAHYIVSKDGNPIGGRTPFASVPYAFSSGGGAATSYSPSTNISTTGNVLDLTNKLSTTVSVGSNQLPNSKIPIFSADEKGRLTNVGEYSANINGDIIGKLDSQYVAKLRGTPLSTVIPSNGQVLQFNGSNWAPANLSGSGPWSYSANTIYPSNSAFADKVAIGSGTASSLLDVKNSGLSPYVGVPVASFLNSNASYNSQGVVSISNQAGGGAALYVQNSNSSTASDGLIIQMSNGASNSDGIRSTHVGSGRAGNFINTSATSTIETLYASANGFASAIRGNNLSTANNSLSIGVYGKTSSAHPNASGVYGENVGSGFGVVGTTSANVGAVVGVNLGNSTNAMGVYGLSSSSSSISTGVFGESKGAGYGVFGINTNTAFIGVVGVYGTTTGTVNSNSGVLGEVGGSAVAVRGVNKGTGNSIQGTKPSGVTAGSAARFEINDNMNPSAAMLSITQGAGAAVQAMAGTPSLSALSLHLMNGHIKSSGNITTSVAAISYNPSGNFLMLLAPSCSNCNDVRGEITFYAHATAAIATGHFAEVVIPFTKPYTVAPVVVASPISDLLGLHFRVTGVTQNEFRIRIYRPAGQTFPSLITSGTSFTFSYYVME